MVDPLQDILKSIRMSGGVFIESVFREPWCLWALIEPHDCVPHLETMPAHIVAYHVVTAGRFWMSLGSEPPIEVRAGEVVLLPSNQPHLLGSDLTLPPVRGSDMLRDLSGPLPRLIHGGDGPETRIACGFLGTAEPGNPLLLSLPPVLKISLDRATARDWVEASVRFAAGELAAGRPASSPLLSRLSEVLLVEALRDIVSDAGRPAPAWLRGMRDVHVGRALSLMHGDPAANWTLERMAREVGLSRTAFVERFGNLIGTPPIRYLSMLRLQTARARLTETRRSIAQIGAEVGYESEEAFSRAFKRHYGRSPAQVRAEDRAGAPDSPGQAWAKSQ